jgi:tetratricopeptide (TPR) repeat protein
MTNRLDPWHLLRYGDAEQGLALLRDAYMRQRSSSHIMELGVAYLWKEDYPSAKAHFKNAIQEYPRHATSFYGMAGVAHWCLGESTAAVLDWHDGLKAQYADASGLGIRLPLLLFVASVLEPGTFQRGDAEKILLEKAKDKRAEQWPGTVAKFVLGQATDENSLALTPLIKEFDRKHREWVIRFYRHLLEFRIGDLTSVQFSEVMRAATDTSQPEFFDPNYFLSLMWSEEFFIARHLLAERNP